VETGRARCFDCRPLRPGEDSNRGQNQHDAQAALYLLRSDVLRMATDSLTMRAALANLYGVTNAVDKEDWDKAHSRLLELKGNYGRN